MKPENLHSFDFRVLDQKSAYKLMVGAIVPRPIAFVSTQSPDGRNNIAPFSFFNGVASHPPTVVISITRKSNGDIKDTLANIRLTHQFVINSVHPWNLDAVHQTSAEYAYGVDEIQEVGLTPISSQLIKPLRIEESALSLECELYKELEIGDGSSGSATLIIGKILIMHVKEFVLKEGRIDSKVLQPICRLGGPEYGNLGVIQPYPSAKVP